ncbi:MAG: carbohydrate ABC transporter permease [Phycisphaeraceae bacterium]|nr:MAG: carbohydrate ABC transporter permease [Phycisphaeraceae bacterium]
MSRLSRPPLPARAAAHAAVYAAALSMLLPFAWMVLTSLKGDSEALTSDRFLPEVWRFDNYRRAVESAELGRFYSTTVVVAVLTTVLGVFYNALAGYAFAKLRFRGRGVAFGFTLATMMLPAQCFFVFAYLFASSLGFIDNLQALVVPFLASGFGIFYMRQAIAAVPDSLIEAGRMDGLGEFDIFWHVVRPAVWPAVAALAIFTFMNSWNSFFWPLIVVDSTGMKTLPLAVAELSSGQYVQSWPVRMAAATILTVPVVVVFAVFQRAFVHGLASTGLKE